MLRHQGGGELTAVHKSGLVRSKDKIGKSDPLPLRDTEH